MTSEMIEKPDSGNQPAPRKRAAHNAPERRGDTRGDTPPPPIGAPSADESHAVGAAAKVNGWVLIRTTDTADGGHRLVYANDLSTNQASRPALVVLTTDAGGRVLHARRDVARRTFTDERQRANGDTHAFDFADSVFRVT